MALFFFDIVKAKKVDIVAKIIRECRYIIYEYDMWNMTALHWAARNNCVEIVKLLIKAGAIVNK